jgi:ElaB/YqjD/DUF883 family membrane-anchored ribosome-binding protein
MNDSPETIRRKIQETKSDLYSNLESLQQQISETVLSASGAINSTVDSVKETVTAVTQGAQDTVQACQNVFDVPRHINRHPWLFFSGAIGIGFFTVRLLSKSKSGCPARPVSSSYVGLSSDLKEYEAPGKRDELHTTPRVLTSVDRPLVGKSPWQRLGNMAASSIQLMLQEAASQATNQALGYLAGQGRRQSDSSSQSSSVTSHQEAGREQNGENNPNEQPDRRRESV